MKKITALLIVIGFFTVAFAQNDKYVMAMEQRISSMDTIKSISGWQELGNSFERIALAEKNQWLPYYYASFCHTMAGYIQSQGQSTGTGGLTDPGAEKAELLIQKADSLKKENSEIYCLKKMIATLFMLGDPASRWQTYGPMASEFLAKARQLNPDNPRVPLLEGQDKYFTPEQFGGNKEEAKTLIGEAEKKFQIFKPESGIHPNWGKPQVAFLKSQLGI